ncbi:hypothetical protein GCM10025870_29470 [Agromyces marinus]|uniref:Uncharacterized protein n=1 Tax=Agromyces marinus TaxID=1389020 RepID=A0ABM8H4Y8_9MICO|nr:hypothetical protein [Agromyces marinus]BDZ55874.1 hypothetical protein GCM10025870_29470 [Agromyces marinus]
MNSAPAAGRFGVGGGGRWALTALATAALLLVGVFLTAGFDSSVGSAIRVVAIALAATLGAVGVAGCCIVAARSARSRPPVVRGVVICAIALGVPVAAGAVLFAGFVTVLAAGLVLGWIVLVVAAGWPTDPDPAARATRPGIPGRVGLRLTALLSALAVLGATAAGVLHVLVWNPLAKVPGVPLADLYATMVARGSRRRGPRRWSRCGRRGG